MIPGLYTYAATALIAGAAAATGAWQVQAWRYDARIADMEKTQATQLADSRKKALDDFTRMQGAKDAAIEEARKRAQANAAAAAAARRDADSLRAQLDSVPARIAAATDSAVREYANASSVVFAECVRSYQALAGVADGHAADVRLMLEAWPQK